MARVRSNSSNSVSLFPFLAVLICAMGALIFLLIVLTRQIRQQTVNDALKQNNSVQSTHLLDVEDKVSPDALPEKLPVEELLENDVESRDPLIASQPEMIQEVQIDPNIELLERLKKLSIQKEMKLSVWSKNQQKLIAEKRKNKQAAIKVASINKELTQIDLQQGLYEGKIKRISQVLKYTDFAEKKIQKKLLESAQKSFEVKNQYAFVPYDGKSGTTRQPLLVECTGSVVKILPEGIEFTSEDFKGYPRTYNPILVVLEALVKYWDAKSEDDNKPYVLIIIRPGGGAAYYTTRKYISTLDADVGYELVEADWNLAMPKLDPQAKAVATKALEKLLEERRVYLESIVLKNPGKYSDQLLRTGQHPKLGRFKSGQNNGSLAGRKISGGAGTKNLQQNGLKRGGNSDEYLDLEGEEKKNNRSVVKLKRLEQNDLSEPEKFQKTPGVKNQKNLSKFDGQNKFEEHSRELNNNRSTEKGEPGSFSIDSIRESKPESFMDYVNERKKQQNQKIKNESGRKGIGRQNQFTKNQSHNQKQSQNRTQKQNQSQNSHSNSGSGGSANSKHEQNSSESQQPSPPVVNLNQQKNKNQFKVRRKWGLYQRNASIGFERNIPVQFEEREMNVGGVTIDLKVIKSYAQLAKTLDETTETIAKSWGYPPTSFYWIPNLTFHVFPEQEKELLKLTPLLDKRELPSKVKILEADDEQGEE